MDSNINIKIISFNCGGLSSVKVANIKHYLQHNAVHILCVQETRLSGECVRPIPGYHLESKNHVNASGCVAGGLALYIRHDIQYEVLQAADPLRGDGTTAIEVLAIVVHPARQSSFTLANVYSRGCSIQALRSLESSLRSSRHHKFLFTGDFNAHHPAWGGSKSCKFGEDVCSWMDESGLVVLNDGSPTRFDGQGTTSIDLSIVSAG